MITTTLRKIRDAKPCQNSWRKLYKHLGGIKAYGLDTPITFQQIIKNNGVDDALWCLRTVPECDSLWRHFAVDCAERIKHLMKDERSFEVLKVARRYATGQATDQELAVAVDAARDAARDAAWYAARDAAADTAADAAWYAAEAAAAAAAEDAERDWQAQRLIELIEAGHWSPVVQQD